MADVGRPQFGSNFAVTPHRYFAIVVLWAFTWFMSCGSKCNNMFHKYNNIQVIIMNRKLKGSIFH